MQEMKIWKHKQITKNKSFEFQFETWKNWWSYFNIDISWTRQTDHAGFTFMFEVMGVMLVITIYDHRHWDDETNDWKIYGQEK